MTYESPISTHIQRTVRELSFQLDKAVLKEVLKCNICVDRNELIKALKYDREQYEKGYADGRADADFVVRCKDCEAWDRRWVPTGAEAGEHFCPIIGLVTEPDFYCKYGEGG